MEQENRWYRTCYRLLQNKNLPTTTSGKLAVFQSHKGLHRMKRLFFGPKALLSIFHNIVMQCFRGVEMLVKEVRFEWTEKSEVSYQ